MFQKVTANFAGARKRYETLDNEQYLVVPIVMLTEGVHVGSEGPLLYESDELSKDIGVCNHKPVVIDHPMMNGQGISACDPTVVEKQSVGLLFNTSWDGRLRTEGWLKEPKLKKIAPKVLDAINSGEMVEVSTGLFHDLEDRKGTWNGEAYTGVVKNLKLDHLAILPDTKGACSIQDGAGLLRNTDEISYDDIRSQLSTLLRSKRNEPTPSNCMSGYCYVCDVFKTYAIVDNDDKIFKVNYKLKNGKVTLDGEPEEVRKVTSYVTANGQTLRNDDSSGPMTIPRPGEAQLSTVMKYQQAQDALQKMYSGVLQESDWGGWVTEVADNFVVWRKDSKLFRLPYTYENDKIIYSGDAEEVDYDGKEYKKRSVDTSANDGMLSPYTTANQGQKMATTPVKPTQNVISDVKDLGNGGQAGDSQTRTTGREQQVNEMIAGGRASEMDRAFLMSLPDDGFTKVSGWVNKGASQPTVPYGYEGIKDRSNVHSLNQQTAEQYAAQAPPEIRDLLMDGLATRTAIKKKLISTIIANKANRFSEQWLLGLNTEALRGIAAIAIGSRQQTPTAAPVLSNYGGQADIPPMFIDNHTPTNDLSEEEVLQIPTINWAEERKVS